MSIRGGVCAQPSVICVPRHRDRRRERGVILFDPYVLELPDINSDIPSEADACGSIIADTSGLRGTKTLVRW